MPDEALHEIHKGGIYYHIYNCGVERRIIFNEKKDYETFQGFLGEYLTLPRAKEHIKKTFTVKGKTYHGVPHQPKNYCQQVELVAYRLQPTCFHLVLHVKTPGALEKFMRSLSTRYSMYYNTKYQHAGSLFAGPYKSAQIKQVSELLALTQYLHRGDGYSSYQEFLGTRATSWVKPAVVVSLFEKSKNDAFKGIRGYQQFVENYTLKPKEQEILERIILKRDTDHHETQPVVQTVTSEPDLVSRSRIPEFIAAGTVFVLLFALGMRNILAISGKTNNPAPTPAPPVLGIETTQPTPTPTVERTIAKPMVQVTTDDEAASVNIREGPTADANIIGKAKSGDTFELVSGDSQWYEVKRADGSTGFISATYITVLDTNK